MKTKLKLSDIHIDQAVTIRLEIDEETVERYQDILEELPPITVFHVDSKYLLADGFHRREAAIRRGWEYIEVEIKDGTYEEASEYAIYANLKYGKPLTKREQQDAVRRLEELHPDWGYRRLAKAIGRSQNFVETVVKSDEMRTLLINTPLEDTKLEEIFTAPKEWRGKIAEQTEKESWSVLDIRDKIHQINLEPERANEILSVITTAISEEQEQAEITPSQGQLAVSCKSTRRTKADFSCLIDADEKRDINALEEEAYQSHQQLQQNQGVEFYHFGKMLAQVGERLKKKKFQAWLEEKEIAPYLAYRAQRWAKEITEAVAQTGEDAESFAATHFSASSFWGEESTKQVSPEEQMKQRYSWEGIANDLENALQRAIQVLHRLPDGKFPSKAPGDDVQKLRFALVQGRTIFKSCLQQLAKVYHSPSKPPDKELPIRSIMKVYQPWPEDISVVTTAAVKTAAHQLQYGEPPGTVVRADWHVKYLKLHNRSYQDLKRKSPFYKTQFGQSSIGARHGGLSGFPQNVGAYAIKLFTPGRLDESGYFGNYLATVLDPFAGPNSRLELTWRCNRNYIAWDCAHEFMKQDRQVRDLLYLINQQCPTKRDAQILLVEDDSRNIDYDSIADMLLTSTPYWDTEYYGPEAAQLGKAKTYEDFLKSLVEVFSRCYVALRPGAYAVVETQDIRRNGRFHILGTDILGVLEEAGFVIDNGYIINYGQAMNAAFKNQLRELKIVPKQHAYLAIARKPDPKLLPMPLAD